MKNQSLFLTLLLTAVLVLAGIGQTKPEATNTGTIAIRNARIVTVTGETIPRGTLLIKDGKIGLDDMIEKYIGKEPWFSRLPNAKDVTVRMLMNHTSGLVRYEFKKEFTDFLTYRR